MTARDELIEVMAEAIFTAGAEAAATDETWELAQPATREWDRMHARAALAAIEARYGEIDIGEEFAVLSKGKLDGPGDQSYDSAVRRIERIRDAIDAMGWNPDDYEPMTIERRHRIVSLWNPAPTPTSRGTSS